MVSATARTVSECYVQIAVLVAITTVEIPLPLLFQLFTLEAWFITYGAS